MSTPNCPRLHHFIRRTIPNEKRRYNKREDRGLQQGGRPQLHRPGGRCFRTRVDAGGEFGTTKVSSDGPDLVRNCGAPSWCGMVAEIKTSISQ
jgi:hypothetical protein